MNLKTSHGLVTQDRAETIDRLGKKILLIYDRLAYLSFLHLFKVIIYFLNTNTRIFSLRFWLHLKI